MTPPRKKLPAWIQPGEWIAASLLALGALFLHVTFFTRVGALWRDEVNSFDFASMPLGQAHALLRYDSFPLLTTVLLRGWIHAAGGADVALRVYGLIVGVLFLAALFFAGRALGGGPPLVSLALVGMNPWMVRTVDSIRPYGWGIVLIVATLGCAWSAVRTQKPAWLVLTAVAAVASVQCMYQNAFLLAAILLAGAFTAWRASDRKTALGLLGAGALAAASLFIYLPGIRAAGEWGMLIRAEIPISRIVKVLAGTVDAAGPVYVGLWIALVVLALVTGVLALRRKGPDAAVFSAVALVLAGSAYLGAILATQVQTEHWYYVPLIAVAGPLLEAALRGRWRIARLLLCLAAGALLLVPAAAFVRVRWTSVDVVAAKVEAAAAPGDLVVLNPFWIGITFQRYYHGKAPWVSVPPMKDLTIVRYDWYKEAMARPGAVQPVLDAMTRTLQSGHRVFWVEGMNSGPEGQPARVLPPAPLPESGWFLGPYLMAWGRETAHHLESHALEGSVVDVNPGAPVMGYEAVTLTEVSGWR